MSDEYEETYGSPTVSLLGQMALFDMKQPWEEVWQGMPEFDQRDLTPLKTLLVHFATWGDYKAFADLIEQKLTKDSRYAWFPPADIEHYTTKRYRRYEP